MFSYWEKQSFLSPDIVIVGAGLVGLQTALHLKLKYPDQEILVLEKGPLPSGASTKNAGFACFGSLAELTALAETLPFDEVMNLVERRYRGLELLRKSLGDEAIGFLPTGGGECIFKDWPDPLGQMERYNLAFKESLGITPFYHNPSIPQVYGWSAQRITNFISNRAEGMVDSGKMMSSLWDKCMNLGIRIFTGWDIQGFTEQSSGICIETIHGPIQSKILAICVNAFTSALIPDEKVIPGRGQILVTQEIPDLNFNGIFHFCAGYGYFRNVGKRILLGGGRHLDKAGETTLQSGITPQIQGFLEEILYEVLLPNKKRQEVTITDRWSGTMGFGPDGLPFCRQYSSRVFGAGRLQGMGVALGTGIANELVQLISESGDFSSRIKSGIN